MKRQFIPGLLAVFILSACASGGGDTSSLRAELEALRTDQEALASRIETHKEQTRDSLQRVEAMVDVLQAELSKSAGEPSSDAPAGADAELEPTSAPPAPATVPAAQRESLAQLAVAALGLAEEPVSQEGESFMVDRHWLRRSLAELAQSRGKPSLSSNRNGGMRIRGVKPRSLPAELGFRNNDVIISINEQLVNTPEGLARTLVDAEGPLVVKIQRRKEELEQTYRFR